MGTFVTLVPKRPDATEPCHYRPINLCITLYKIYAKLMVERMKLILPYLICPEQGAFIGDRRITDNVYNYPSLCMFFDMPLITVGPLSDCY